MLAINPRLLCSRLLFGYVLGTLILNVMLIISEGNDNEEQPSYNLIILIGLAKQGQHALLANGL